MRPKQTNKEILNLWNGKLDLLTLENMPTLVLEHTHIENQ